MKKLAFLILAHADPEHLGRLVKALDYQSDVFIHVDKKTDIAPFRAATQGTRVFFLDERVTVSWAGISMIEAQLALMRTALSTQETYSHLVYLSGSDYLIKPIQEIHRRMTSTPDHEFIRFVDMRAFPVFHRMVTRRWFQEPFITLSYKPIRFIDKVIRKGLSMMQLPHAWDHRIIPYLGSQWCALTPACCRYVLNFHQENPWFLEMNRYTFSPDEHYIHTIVGNSSFEKASDGIQPFEGLGQWRLANLHIIHPSLAKWYTLDDWDEIVQSDKLFVRKVRSLDGRTLVARIDKDLLNLT